jgi:sortase A
VFIVAGVGLIGAGAVLDTSGIDHAQIERQREHFEALEQMPTETPLAQRSSLAGAAATATAPLAAHSPDDQSRARTDYPSVRIEPDTQPNAPATPTPPPAPVDMPPATHIAIPAVGVDADILPVAPKTDTIDGQLVLMWPVVDWAAGHHDGSADPGEGGNIVLAGHDDVRGEVFHGLHDIDLGDEVQLTSANGIHRYVVVEVHLRRERGAQLSDRLAAGEFMAPMPEERLTLITCWPYGIDDHRLIVIAKPLVAPTSDIQWER